MIIAFDTDQDVTGEGFVLDWNSAPAEPANAPDKDYGDLQTVLDALNRIVVYTLDNMVMERLHEDDKINTSKYQ